jgi:hypothetical protein
MIETDLGCVTAYADAVAQGYTGTRKEFSQVLANFADSATQVAKDRTAVETAKKSVEVMQSDVTQKQETATSNMNTAVEAAEKAKQSASDAEASKQAAAQSEQNINNTVTAFDDHVEEKIAGFDSRVFEAVEQSKEEINTTKQQAINTITNQQDASVNIVKTEGEKIITKMGNDAKTVADDRATVEEAAQTVLNNAQEVAQNTQTVASNTEKAAASAEGAKTSADNAAQSAKSVEDASKQIEQNKKDVDSLKEDISTKITKFYASSQGETHITDSDNGKIQDMMIYGKSSQDGTPTPENLVEIKNVVNPTVKVCGKNLWNPILGGYINGTNGSIKEASKTQVAVTDFIKTSGKDITVIARNFSSAIEIGYAYRIGFYNAEKKWIKNINLSNGNKYSINTFNVTGTEYIRVSAPSGIYDTIQIEYGSEATPYEPYTEQSVQLPYTLNAIPVTFGGNVTIDGQQYIADYVDVERGKLVKMVDSSKLDNTQSIVDKTEWLLAEQQEIDLIQEEVQALKTLATYYPTTNIFINSEQLDGYTVFNYPISMANGWNYVKKQLNDNRDCIYDMDTQLAEAYVNSEYAVALTELEV